MGFSMIHSAIAKRSNPERTSRPVDCRIDSGAFEICRARQGNLRPSGKQLRGQPYDCDANGSSILPKRSARRLEWQFRERILFALSMAQHRNQMLVLTAAPTSMQLMSQPTAARRTSYRSGQGGRWAFTNYTADHALRAAERIFSTSTRLNDGSPPIQLRRVRPCRQRKITSSDLKAFKHLVAGTLEVGEESLQAGRDLV